MSSNTDVIDLPLWRALKALGRALRDFAPPPVPLALYARTGATSRARRAPSVDLPYPARTCPHCAGELGYWQRMNGAAHGWRCLDCRCRWDSYRRLKY